MRRPAGFVLVVVSGLLAVITMVAASFTLLSGHWRGGMRQGVDAVRARLLSRSGVARAVSGLRAGETPGYGGEDYDGDGVWAAAGIERVSQEFRTGRLDIDECPVESALRPTWFATRPGFVDGGGGAAPEWTRVGNRDLGYTGRLRGAYGDGTSHRGDTYALKVLEAGGIWVDGGDPAAPPTSVENAVLRRILGNLAEAVDQEDGADDGSPVDRADGHAIIGRRPLGGWRGLSRIRDIAWGGSAAKEAALLPYLAASAWVDRKVIRPNAPALFADPAQVRNVRTWSDIRTGAYMPDATADPLPPVRGALTLEATGRAPVPLGWASRNPAALVALLADLHGTFLDEVLASPAERGDRLGTVRSTVLAWDEARSVARRLSLRERGAVREGIGTWEAWTVFCDDLVDEDLNGNRALDAPGEDVNGDGRLQTDEDLDRDGVADPDETDLDGSGRVEIRPLRGAAIADRQAKADILKANFNPNPDLNKFNPNRTLWRSVDKADLVVWSTEFCLWPCFGFEVASAGRVTDARGDLLAQSVTRARTSPSRVARITTQREFAAGVLGSLDLAGDEGGVRRPGDAAYLSESAGTSPTWGHRLASAGWMDGTSQGAALQTYPEPAMRIGGSVQQTAADWDGNLQLATVETMTDDTYGVATIPADMKMLARYDDGLDLDVADGAAGGNQADALQAPPGNSVLDPNLPNTFHPDGVYAERDRAPAYAIPGNVHGYHGTMSFWVKPSYLIRRGDTPGGMPRNRRWVLMSNKQGAVFGQGIQFFAVANMWYARGFAYGIFFEDGHQEADLDKEHRSVTTERPRLEAHRWHLATVAWDSLVPPPGMGGNVRDACEVVLDGGEAVIDRESGDLYFNSDENDPLAADDIAANDALGAPWIVLGRRRVLDESSVRGYAGEGADATFDELAVWDFSGAQPAIPATNQMIQAPRVVAAERFATGRYYKGGAYWRVTDPAPAEAAGAYVSAPLALPAGARIEEVRWTFLRSAQRDNAGARRFPDDYAAVEILAPGGTNYPGGDDTWRSPRAPGTHRWRVERNAPASFRLRALFCRDAAIPDDVPVLDSPVLDDVTVLYRVAGGPAFASWSETAP